MMKILPFKIAKPVNSSCWVQQDVMPHLYDILHRHIEFQITLIEKSSGNAIVGDRISAFRPGDVYVFGPNLPHAFRNDPEFYNQDHEEMAQALSIYFEWEVFGSVFWELPENRLLVEFLSRANQGVYFAAFQNQKLVSLVKTLSESMGLDRILGLLNLLQELALSEHGAVLSEKGVYSVLNETDEKRLDAVYRFTLNEYHRHISLTEVAEVAHMTVNSFCRYFKTRTRKSYLDFLMAYRIGQACRLLQQEEISISEIGFRVGFGNISNFNRKFLFYHGCTPREYRKKQLFANVLG